MVNLKSVLLGVSLVSLLTVILTLSILYGNAVNKNSKPGTSTPETSKMCTSKECINAASLILNNMDTSVDPCEDFNLFSCGNFIKTKRIPDDSTSIDAFTDLRNNLAFGISDLVSEPIGSDDINSIKNVKRYYTSCLNEALLETTGENELKDIIRTVLDGWPMIDDSDPNQQDTLDKLLKYRKISSSPIFNVYVTSNPTNPLESLIKVDQAGWFYNKEYYNNKTIVTAYNELMTEVLGYLNPSNKNLATEIKEMYEMEKSFALYRLDVGEKRNLTFQKFALSEMNTKFPGFDWNTYIKNLFAEFSDTIKISDNETIIVEDLSYVRNASLLYSTYDAKQKRDLFNMFGWSFLKDRLSFLPKKYRDASLNFNKIFSGSNTAAPRSRTCANAILDRMPYAAGRLYVAKFFDEKSKETALEMIENIRREFKVMVKENEWMDSVSKDAALAKADQIEPKIGYPDYTYNDTYLDTLYKYYEFNEKRYLNNAVIASRESVRESFSKLRDQRDRKRWISGPAVVNAFYSSELNQICFPAGILQQPFYNGNVPKYLNYGAIGSVIGHEITHGFDDNGRKYNKDGVFVPDGSGGLWTDETIKKYLNQTSCIIKQYSSFNATQINTNLNGVKTQGENIADNGGVKESFRAYQNWAAQNAPEPLLPGLNFTQNQLFFINYAQVWCSKMTDQNLKSRILDGVHSPGFARIIGPTSNTEFFSQTFNCKPNQANNPKNKCNVW